MSVRAVAVAFILAGAVTLLAACGDDDEDDPRIGEVAAVSETATYAWADAGAEGLYDYVSSGVSDVCTADDLGADLVDREAPTDWKQIRDVEFPEDDRSTATVIIIVGTAEHDEDWTFSLEGESWRISDLPGLDECEAT